MASVFTLTGILLLLVAANGKQLDKYVADMLDTMDQTADPCEDFHQYACGNWVKKYCSTDQSKHVSSKLKVDLQSKFTTFLESLKTQTDLSELDKLLSDNYELCMKSALNEEKLEFDEAFKSAMKRVNISTRDGESDLLHIIRFGAAMMREIGFTKDYMEFELQFGATSDRIVMTLTESFFALCHNCKEDAVNLSDEETDSSLSQQAVTAYLEEMLQISNQEASTLYNNYAVMFHDWRKQDSKQMDRNQAKKIMVSKAKERWREYRQKDRSEKCIDFIENHSLGAFLRSYAKRELKREVAQLKDELDTFVNATTGAFATLISTNRWMPLNETLALIEYIDDTRYQLSLPDWCLSEETVLAKSRRYIANVSTKENDRRACQSLTNDPVNKLLCLLPKQSPEDLVYGARYDPYTHSLNFPLGALLEPSFVAGSQLQPVRFGRLGHVISHELMHGVYLYINWRAEKLGGEFNINNEKVVKCVVDSYKTGLSLHNLIDSSAASTDFQYLEPDPSGTAPEDIPDIEGLKLTYLAYTFQKRISPQPPKPESIAKFSDDQLFFISYANNFCDCQTEKLEPDSHSLHRIRAEIPAWEMPQFGTAFQCKPSSTYNTRKKCKIYSELNLAS